MKLAEFKRLVKPGDKLQCVRNERIPSRAGEKFTVTRNGPSVMRLDWNGELYFFTWPLARDTIEVSEQGITYRLPGGEVVEHGLVSA